MRVKPWYCPHCGGFKNTFQIYDMSPVVDAPIADMRCKHCNRKVLPSEKALMDFINEKCGEPKKGSDEQ